MKTGFNELTEQESHLLAKILLHAPVSRKWVHEHSPWAKSKTDLLLREIARKGALETAPRDNSKSGRNPYAYFGSTKLGYTLGIELSLAADRVVIIDINERNARCMEYVPSYTAADVTKSLISHIKDALKKCDLTTEDLNSIGVATYGIFDQDLSQILKFQNNVHQGPIAVRGPLQEEFNIPVYLGRAKELVCFKEYKKTLISSQRTFLNVNMNYGVGLGIFIAGESYVGRKGLSGDLSHIKVEGNDLQCYCGDKGCLLTLLSYQGLCRQARRRYSALPETTDKGNIVFSSFEGPDFEGGIEYLIQLAIQNDKTAMDIIHEAGLILGKILASAVSILAPEIMIVHSNLIKTGDLFTHPLALTIRRNCHAVLAQELEIRFHELEPYSIAEGSAIHAKDLYLQGMVG